MQRFARLCKEFDHSYRSLNKTGTMTILMLWSVIRHSLIVLAAHVSRQMSLLLHSSLDCNYPLDFS